MNHHPRILAHFSSAGSGPGPCTNVSEQPCAQIIQTYTPLLLTIFSLTLLIRYTASYIYLITVIVHTLDFHCRNAGSQGHAELEFAGSYNYLPEGILHRWKRSV